MEFNKSAAPKTRVAFMQWYEEKTERPEEHNPQSCERQLCYEATHTIGLLLEKQQNGNPKSQ